MCGYIYQITEKDNWNTLLPEFARRVKGFLNSQVFFLKLDMSKLFIFEKYVIGREIPN